MPNSIISLGVDLSNAVAQIGPKAATLNQLALAGFPVPPGFCIPVAVFNAALAPFAAQLRVLRSTPDLHEPQVAQRTAQMIAHLLADLEIPLDLRDELAHALPALGSDVVAVRSSATLEDLADASFAGQYESIIGVTGETALGDAILTCWRSYFSANALSARAAYANRHTDMHDDDRQGMAVLIQPLIDAECAGVCFTVDPVRLRADLLLVTAAWGLGVGVVDGTAPVDTTRVRRFDLGVEDAFIADKHTMIRCKVGGNQPVAVPTEQRRIACLPEAWLRRVAQFCLALEQHFGQPQDIEWAIADQQVWLLQSRPITTLPADVVQAAHFPIAWADEAERTRPWWLNQMNERRAAILLPAEIEFVQNCSTQGGQAAVQLVGAAKTRWRKAVNGRIYMAVADSGISPGDQRIRHAALHDLFDRLQAQNITMWEHWGPEIIRATERLAAFDRETADGNALADHLEDALAAAARHWMVHTMMPRYGHPELLLDSYRQLTGKSQAEAQADLPFLLQGAETVQTRLIERLYDLACLAVAQPEVAALVQDKAPDSYARLCDFAEAEPFVQQFEQLLAIYDGRFGLFTRGRDGESTLALTLPWREVPEHVLAMISLYLPMAQENQAGDPAHAPRAVRERTRRAQQASVEAICAAATDPALVARFRQQLDYAQRNAAFLDNHNHYIDQLSEGQYAQALIDGGRWLAARGDLPHAYTIFWLHPPEILTALRAAVKTDYSQTIAERQAQFAFWESLQTPAYIGLPDPQLPAAARAEANPSDPAQLEPSVPPNTLVGQAVSVGRHTGRARIIDTTVSLPTVAPGDVLIAAHAGPLWIPVFPILAGLVLEAGGPGDHTAITVREFGIPAVFDAANATRRIPPGAWVTVDGETGQVSWE